MRFVTFGTFATFTLATLAAPWASDTQPPAHVPRIGLLWCGSPAAVPSPHPDALRQDLRVEIVQLAL
ncbi:MAG: hypothetical protein ACRERE_36180 [Candidatus Entotheonellia bacterium]